MLNINLHTFMNHAMIISTISFFSYHCYSPVGYLHQRRCGQLALIGATLDSGLAGTSWKMIWSWHNQVDPMPQTWHLHHTVGRKTQMNKFIINNSLSISFDTNLRSVCCSFLWFQQSRVEWVVGEAKGDSFLSLVVHRSTLKSTNTLADNLLWRLASKLFSSNPVIYKPGVKLMYPICAQQCVILQMCANTQSDVNLNRKLWSSCSVIKRGDISPSPTKVLSHISSAKNILESLYVLALKYQGMS